MVKNLEYYIFKMLNIYFLGFKYFKIVQPFVYFQRWILDFQCGLHGTQYINTEAR